MKTLYITFGYPKAHMGGLIICQVPTGRPLCKLSGGVCVLLGNSFAIATPKPIVIREVDFSLVFLI